MKKNLSLALALVMALALAVPALAAESDFTIEDGVLTKYNGPGGDVVIPDGVTRIRDGAFEGCTGLTKLTIPASVTRIDAWDQQPLLMYNAGLTAIEVDAGNQNYASIDGVLFSAAKDELLRYPPRKQGAYTVPDGVTGIRPGAFINCTGLTSVAIPTSVTFIGEGMFEYGPDLKDVYYAGTEEQWNAIKDEYRNGILISATIHYNSTMPAEPTQPTEPADPAQPSTPAAGTYTVKKWDTWGQIALNNYGTYSRAVWTALKNANKGAALKEGATLTLPEKIGSYTRLAPQVPAEGEKLYTVKAGDTLGQIAAATYKDINMYKAIFERNSDRLVNANSIYEGQVIVLPVKK